MSPDRARRDVGQVTAAVPLPSVAFPEWCAAARGLRVAVMNVLRSPWPWAATYPATYPATAATAGSPDSSRSTAARLRALVPALKELQEGRVEYRIPVVGPMKSGKSTLLNAVLCQDLLPARGPAMTILPTEVVPVARGATPEPLLVFKVGTVAVLGDIAAQLARPGRQAAIAEAVRRNPQLQSVADAIDRRSCWTPGGGLGRAAVRDGLTEANDLVRLGLSALPEKTVLPLVRRLRAAEVYVPVPWLDAEPLGGRLVLVDTPGPDEYLVPGVLHTSVSREIRRAHELLVVADTTRLGADAEASIRRLIDRAWEGAGQTDVFIAANRADMASDLLSGWSEQSGRYGAVDLVGVASRAAVNGSRPAPPVDQLRAIRLQVAPHDPSGWPWAGDGVVFTAARHGLAAAAVLWPQPVGTALSAGAVSMFLETCFPFGAEQQSEDSLRLRTHATDAWQRSGIPALLDAFIAARAREPGRHAARVVLDRLDAALGSGPGAGAVSAEGSQHPLAKVIARRDHLDALLARHDRPLTPDWSTER